MPLLAPPPPPTARPGCGRRRLGGRRWRRSKRRNWAELPLDVLLLVFHKLEQLELIFGAPARVCRSWHDAVCEPELWRRVNIRGHSLCFRHTVNLNRMARLCIWFSAGQCQEFFGQHDVDDNLLLFLAERAHLLKTLHLTRHVGLTCETLIEAIKKFPLLEDLELWGSGRYDAELFELVATACPRLKHFKHIHTRKYSSGFDAWGWEPSPAYHREASAIARMHELRSLKLFYGGLDNQGLTAILDGCPHLESLDMRCYDYIIMDNSLRAKCARIKTKNLYPKMPSYDSVYYRFRGYPDDNAIDYSQYFDPGSLVGGCDPEGETYRWFRYDEPDCEFFDEYSDYSCDSEDSDHSRLLSGAEETEFEYWGI